MDGQESPAEARDLRRRPLDRVGDVMQLQIDEDLLARRSKPADERQSVAPVYELHADLVEGHGVADRGHEPFGRGGLRDIEGDDQPVAGR